MTPDQYRSISDLYALLSRLWISEVDKSFLQAIYDSPIAETLGVEDQTIRQSEQLEVDFCALFIGPKDHLPPIQSVWMQGQLQTQTADSMHAFFDLLGLDKNELLPDHLGNQLRVMSAITGGLSLSSVRPELVDIGRSFFERHLTWPAPLLGAGVTKAKTHFYRNTIQLTIDLLSSESEYWSHPTTGSV